jgi:hypothetical protein
MGLCAQPGEARHAARAVDQDKPGPDLRLERRLRVDAFLLLGQIYTGLVRCGRQGCASAEDRLLGHCSGQLVEEAQVRAEPVQPPVNALRVEDRHPWSSMR